MKKFLFSVLLCGVLSSVFMSGCSSSTEDKIAKLKEELKELNEKETECLFSNTKGCKQEIDKKQREVKKEIRKLEKELEENKEK